MANQYTRIRPDKHVLKKHIDDGLDANQIAEIYGVIRPTVYKWVAYHGLHLVNKRTIQYNLNGSVMMDALRLEATYQQIPVRVFAEMTGKDVNNIARWFYQGAGMHVDNWLLFARILGIDDVFDRVRALTED